MTSRPSMRAAWLALGTILLVVLFYGPTDNWRWDPSFYYAQLRSPIIDGDFNFRDETQPPNGVTRTTALGLQPSPWPVGPALFWAPFFLAAHAVTSVILPVAADGLTVLYIGAVSAGSALYGLVGVWVCYRLGRFYVSPPLAGLAAGLSLAGTPVLYYIFRQPLMAHSASFLVSAALVFACLSFERGQLPIRHSGLVFGTLVGLNAIVRWASVLLIILPLGLLVWHGVAALHHGDRATTRRLFWQAIALIIAATAAFLPQLALWYRLHGSWLVFPSIGFSTGLIPTNLLSLFLHTNRGIVLWLPTVVLGFAGLWWLPERRLKIVAGVYLTAYVWLLAIWADWYGGGGMGARYFIDTIPLAVLGLAALARRVTIGRTSARWPVVCALVAGGLVLHQLMLMTMVEQGWVPLPDYFAGRALDLGTQANGWKSFLMNPAVLITQRPNVGVEHQTLIASLLAGQMNLRVYVLPAIALVTIPVGLCAIIACLKRPRAAQLAPWLSVAALTFCFSVFMVLLVIGRG